MADRTLDPGHRASCRSLSASGRVVQSLSLAPLIMIAVFVVFGLHGHLPLGGRYHAAVVADSTLGRPFRLLPVPMLLLGMALAAVLLWRTGRLLHDSARRHNGLSLDRIRDLDARPPVVYLRSRTDDPLTIRTSPLAERSLLDKLAVRQTELSSFAAALGRGDPAVVRGAVESRDPMARACTSDR